MMNLLRLSFLPQSNDFGLLLLRLGLGGSMFYFHGLAKVQGFSAMSSKFPAVFGIPSNISLALATFAEAGCTVLLMIGLLARFAALNLVITMAVAFIVAHKAKILPGDPASGELAYVYLVGFAALLFTGPGKFSADGR